MRKMVVFSILFTLLYASGFARRVDTFADTPILPLQSSYHAGRSSVLTGSLERAKKDAADHAALEERAMGCTSTTSMLLDLVERDRDDQDEQLFHEVSVRQLADSRAFYFVSGMTIDADGAPNAYGPDNNGLDELANAGEPARWNGIITDANGDPLVQQQSDPFPGYYISCTSLADTTRKFEDPTRYVDASKIPYVALPQDVAEWGGARLGDFAVVMNLRNGKSAFAIYADIGTVGEGSVALADALGIRSNARHGGESGGILYLWFPGSGNSQPRTVAEIQNEGEKLLIDHWSASEKWFSCAPDHRPAAGEAKF
jgi:glycosyl hydrolase group 75 (putative chitosanase)